jgi:hypothetical protein
MYHFLPLLLLCIFVWNFFTCPLLQQDPPNFLATLPTPPAPSQIMPSLRWSHPSYSMMRWSSTRATIVHTRKWKSSRLKTWSWRWLTGCWWLRTENRMGSSYWDLVTWMALDSGGIRYFETAGEILVVCFVWIYSGSRYDSMWWIVAGGEVETAVGLQVWRARSYAR